MSLTTHEEISRRAVLRSPLRRGTVRTPIPVEAMSPEAIFPERSRLPLLSGAGARREPRPPAAIPVAARPSELSHWPLLPGAGARREPRPPAAIPIAARPSELSHWPLLPGAGARREPRPPAAISVAARPSEASLHEEIPFHTVPRPPIPSELSLKGTDKEFVRNLEIFVRGRMPAAFNQLEDLYRDPQTLYRWERTERGIQYLIDHFHTIDRTVEDVRGGRHSSIQDAVMLGHAGLTFGGGACNDYSAAGLLKYMESDEPYPISRFWAPGMGHSFDVVGDTRMRGAMVLDPWLTHRDPQQFWETVLPQERLQVINEWAPRYKGEGSLLSWDYRRKIDAAEFKKSADGVDEEKSKEEQRRLLERYRAAKTRQERQALHLYRHPAHQPLEYRENKDRHSGLSLDGNTSVPFWDISRSMVLRGPVDWGRH